MFRYRAVDRLQREQLRWLILAGVLVALGILAQPIVTALVSDLSTATEIGNAIASLTVAAVPVAIGIGILRYRLYDIDVVLNKTVVYGALAAFITGVYVAIVVGIGTPRGPGRTTERGALDPRDRGGRDRLPTRARARAAVREPPRLREARDTVRGAVRVLRPARRHLRGRGAAAEDGPDPGGRDRCGANRHLAREGDRRSGPMRRWPIDAPALSDLSIDPFPDAFIPVRHQGELLGALSLEKRAGETLSATEQKLVEDLAGQAGLVLRNVRLTEELLARLEDLKASRQRLVAAQDEERRKLERNLHDGAQQQLVALSVKARLAQQLARRDPAQVARMLEQIQTDTNDALENLRDLARGIYPPLLQDQGLVAALEAQARKAAVPTTVDGDGVGRFGQDVEAAVYFSCLEALQNVAKYAGASRATIALSNGAGSLDVHRDRRRRRLRQLHHLVRHRAAGHRRPAGGAGRNAQRPERARKGHGGGRNLAHRARCPRRRGRGLDGRSRRWMVSRWRRAAPWIVFGVIVALALMSVAMAWKDQGLLALIAVAPVSVGTLILVRARNRIGWLFDVAAVAGLSLTMTEVYLFLHVSSMPDLPGAGYAAIINQVSVFPGADDARAHPLVVPGWAPSVSPLGARGGLLIGATVLLCIGLLVTPGPTDANYAAGILNPLGAPSVSNLASILATIGGFGLLIGTIASVVSLVVRFHRSRGDERQQLRWLAAVGGWAVCSSSSPRSRRSRTPPTGSAASSGTHSSSPSRSGSRAPSRSRS